MSIHMPQTCQRYTYPFAYYIDLMENMSKGRHNDNLDFITVGYTLYHRMASLPTPLIVIFDGIASEWGRGRGGK